MPDYNPYVLNPPEYPDPMYNCGHCDHPIDPDEDEWVHDGIYVHEDCIYDYARSLIVEITRLEKRAEEWVNKFRMGM